MSRMLRKSQQEIKIPAKYQPPDVSTTVFGHVQEGSAVSASGHSVVPSVELDMTLASWNVGVPVPRTRLPQSPPPSIPHGGH